MKVPVLPHVVLLGQFLASDADWTDTDKYIEGWPMKKKQAPNEDGLPNHGRFTPDAIAANP